jgi:hypothetical protein
MPGPASAVDICNLALDRLGTDTISSILTPVSEKEVVCARHYDKTRKQMLRRFVFNFSRKLDTWTPDPTVTPAFGYTNAYALPNDFIRLMAIGDVSINQDVPGRLYAMSDNYLYCDSGQVSTAGDMNVEYIFDAQQVIKFDALFVDVLVLQLAKNMAYKFTNKQSIITGVADELKDAYLAAAAVAGQEKPPRRVQRSKLRDIRRAYGIYRDNTRIW